MDEKLEKMIEREAVRTGFHYHPGTSSYSLGKHVGHIRGFIEGARFVMGMMGVNSKINKANEDNPQQGNPFQGVQGY